MERKSKVHGNAEGIKSAGTTLPDGAIFYPLASIARVEHHEHMDLPLKIVVEKHSDGYVAYPLGLARGAVVGQGDTYEAALSDVRSAIAFHVETFGIAALAAAGEDPVLEAFVAETAVPA
jgi:hypothetical protein